MTFPQARLTDMHLCNAAAIPPPPLPVPIPIVAPGAPTVLVGKLPAARVTDMCAAVPPHPIAKGSMTVMICNLPAARITDLAACGGMVIKGEFTVLTGG